jgi:hypothetical protein
MAYDNFTKEDVFTNSALNVLCNRFYNILEEGFAKNDLDTKFCITGTVAKIIQGAALSDIPVIAFVTNDAVIYKFCSNELIKQLGAKALVFKNRIQIEIENVYIEVWFSSNIGTINPDNGFFVQDTADIPTNIK